MKSLLLYLTFFLLLFSQAKSQRCDSTYMVATHCDSIVSPSQKYTWYSSAIYTDTFKNVLNCDSVIYVNVTILRPGIPIDTTVSQLSNCDSMWSNEPNATSYGWYTALGLMASTRHIKYPNLIPGVCYYLYLYKGGCEWKMGCFYCDTLSGIRTFDRNDVLIYPNPNNGRFYYEVSNRESGGIFYFYSTTGMLIHEQRTTSTGRIEINLPSSISEGLYLVRFQGSESVEWTRIIVKQH